MISVELRHHYGWQTYHIEADSIESAAKSAVRKSHLFLSDDNHLMEIEGSYVVVRRTHDADPPAITPLWAVPGFRAGAVWFSTPFREPPKASAVSLHKPHPTENIEPGVS